MVKNRLTIEEIERRYLSKCLIDDALMNVAFKDNLPAVEHILRIILDKPDIVVQSSDIQEYMAGKFSERSVKLDITAKDSLGKVYNIEMQCNKSHASPKRGRFHCSMLDVKNLNVSEDFDLLPETYVIFITKGDYFGSGLPIYSIRRTIEEADNREYGDLQHIVYVDATHYDDSPLGKLMKDLTTPEAEKISSKVLSDAVKYAKNEVQKEMIRVDYLLTDEEIKETFEEGKAKGYNKGYGKGKAEGIAEGFAQMSDALRQLGVPEETIQAASKTCQCN